MGQTTVKILRFPPSDPSIDWVKNDLLDAVQGPDELIERVKQLYSYLKWSDIYRQTHPGVTDRDTRDENYVAHGLLVKYYRLMRGQDPQVSETYIIKKAEEMLKASNEEIRRRKGTK